MDVGHSPTGHAARPNGAAQPNRLAGSAPGTFSLDSFSVGELWSWP